MTSLTSLARDKRGVVFLEFLVVLVPLWIFALCVFQLALIAQANLIVKRSAAAAARSAVVVLPDDPNEYGGEPEMSIARNPLSDDDLSHNFTTLSASSEGGPADALRTLLSGGIVSNLGRSRLNAIRFAAHVPLMPLAPAELGRTGRPTLRGAIAADRSLLSSLYHQPFTVAVTFPGQSGDFVEGPEITVRVSYAYPCSVPLARWILCDPFDELGGQGDWKQAFLVASRGFGGGRRFRRLHHEATLLIQDAPYTYRPRES